MPDATFTTRGDTLLVRRFEIVVTDGPDRGARVVSEEDEQTVGTAAGTSLRLTDPAVSRHHCVVRACERGLELRDLGSTNGTSVGDTEVVRGFIKSGAHVQVGSTTLRITVLADEVEYPLAAESRFGEIHGASQAMRRLYPLLARAAASDATVLVQGETGTGKELIAEAIHAASARRARPFVIVDCGALPRQLAESELFGHVRGAFTGAVHERAGAFEDASGGTIFLDEIGELPLDLQPLLLRALENQTIRPVGTNLHRPIDVRVIAASHRDLRVEVNAKRFRADLYYRLNVIRVAVPALRDRDGDIALLATRFWSQFRAGQQVPKPLVAELVAQSWPGNVRELRNAVQRSALVGWSPDASQDPDPSHAGAKQRALQQWEKPWIELLLAAHDHNLTAAARTAQMSRSHLRRLVQQYDVPRPASARDDAPDDA